MYVALLPAAVAARQAPPGADGGTPAAGVDELVLETTIDAPPLAFVLVSFVTFEPGTSEAVHAAPGPAIVSVVEGTLTRRVEGSATVVRAGEAGAGAPEGEGFDHALGAGDALFAPGWAAPTASRNDGDSPAVWLEISFVLAQGGGAFAVPTGEADAVSAGSFAAPDLAALGMPVRAVLRRVELPPSGVIPPPAAGHLRELATEPGPGGTVAQLADGSATNLGSEPIVVYALTLSRIEAGTPGAGTPAA